MEMYRGPGANFSRHMEMMGTAASQALHFRKPDRFTLLLMSVFVSASDNWLGCPAYCNVGHAGWWFVLLRRWYILVYAQDKTKARWRLSLFHFKVLAFPCLLIVIFGDRETVKTDTVAKSFLWPTGTCTSFD